MDAATLGITIGAKTTPVGVKTTPVRPEKQSPVKSPFPVPSNDSIFGRFLSEDRPTFQEAFSETGFKDTRYIMDANPLTS